MKNNVVYINFSYRHKKRRLFNWLEKLFRGKSKEQTKVSKVSGVINIENYDNKHIL